MSDGIAAARGRRSAPRSWVASWTLYDLANTIWSYGVLSYAVGLYLTSDAGFGEAAGNIWLQVAIAASVGLNALLSPAIGALSDRTGRRLPWLFAFTLLAIVPSMAIPFVPPAAGVLLFCIANFGYQSALIHYDASIRLVSTVTNRGWISGLGNGLGYLGTVLIGALILFGGLSVQQVFIVAPLLFGFLALPIFLVLRETPQPATSAPVGILPVRATLHTIRELDRYPGLRRFLVARFFYTDALNTVIVVMAVFAVQAVGFTEAEANYVLVALATTAVVGGVILGRVTDRIGPKRTLMIVLVLWAVGLLIASLAVAPVPFIVAGVVIGFGFGGLSGSDRVLMLRLSPADRLGEFYGLYGLVGKGSQVIGGIIYGLTVGVLLGPLGPAAYQIGLLTLLGTMLIGLWLLRGVPERAEA